MLHSSYIHILRVKESVQIMWLSLLLKYNQIIVIFFSSINGYKTEGLNPHIMRSLSVDEEIPVCMNYI